MIGRTLAHYRITAAIGSGGMGEVYRAIDTKLGREVALKVLPPAMAASPERLERFRREAKALAALDHPGIVTVFSVEEAEGVHFLTMQLVEGQALDSAIPEGGLPVQRVLDIARALADALAAAHDKGIVHRDLKPANVMITSDERVKVLDFGLAKELRAAADPMDVTLASSPHTEVGVVMGTPAYMSPEQVVGAALDHRADIFSLGVLLYEMVTGRRPFQGGSSAETTSAILRDTPAAVTELRADVPGDLARIIRRCLEKDPRHRIQTARDVGNELRDLARQRTEPASPAAPRAPRALAAPDSGAARADEGFWVAVLPFKYKGADIDLTALAEGLSEEIVTGLSRFSYLRVIARSSIARFSGEAVDVRAVGKELGARYVMEGSLRQAGAQVRVAVQLVDTVSGSHLWAETYDRPFRPEEMFTLQDELVPRIVSTVADMQGVLPRRMSDAVRGRPPGELSPYEAVLRGCGYYQRVRPDEHAAVRDGLERAVEEAPHYADAWVMLSMICGEEHRFGFNVKPDPLGRALHAARRAVDAAPSNHLSHLALAQAHYFRRELDAFRNAAERAVALNPMDGFTVEYLGHLVAFAGDWERGRELGDRARQLNPHHPAWYWALPMLDAFRRCDYREARALVPKAVMPGQYYSLALFAAIYGQLGEREAAGEALRELLALRPDFAEVARDQFGKWYLPQLVEQLVDGLRKAGLEVPAASSSSTSTTESRAPSSPSGASRADEGFWVAVLPFRHRGAGLEALAEGLTEEIVTGLSRFSYLRVISRGATSRYGDAAADAGTVGKEIGARYVMEGSLGHAGGRLRVAVQLVDASTGAHLWAETYTRPFEPDHIFAIQDDLVPRIVSTSADHFGVLARTISDAVREKPLDQLSPYEALMRGFGYHFRLTPEEHAAARVALERAVERAPANADCWAMLSWIYSHEHAHGFNPRPGSLDRALAAARRAVDLAPSNHVAQQALAVVLFFRRDIAGCRSAAERALALNPLDGSNEAIFLITFTGDWERGCGLIRWAMEQNPHHPRWYGLILAINEYRTANYRGAVDEVVRASMQDGIWRNAVLAAAHGQLGEAESARAALRPLSASEADIGKSARELLEKWLDPPLVEHVMEGLRKAGLGSDAGGLVSAPAAELASVPVSIAVLPFSDLSSAKDQEYLCEGMAEEVMHALVRVDGIRVASRTSAFRAQRDGADLPAIARALSVGHVLEGNVRTSGSRLRVTAQLTDVATGFHLWSERFDREAEDVFAVQDEIAAGVVEAVRARLGPGRRAVHARPHAANLEAYRAYLTGRYLRHSKNDHHGAMQAFEEAVGLDPSHAPSWVGLAEGAVLAALYGAVPAGAASAKARNALLRAQHLQGESAEALAVEGLAAFIERRWHDAETAFRRALELEPDNVRALVPFGQILSIWGACDEAQAALARARAADPLAALPCAATGVGLMLACRLEEAEGFFEKALAFEPENTLALWGSCMALVGLGRFDEGIGLATRAAALSRRAPFFLGLLGWALGSAGRRGEARSALEELRAQPAASRSCVPEAWVLATLGETETAFARLEQAEAEYQAFLYFTGLPPFDPLRADARFAATIERLGFPPAFAGSQA